MAEGISEEVALVFTSPKAIVRYAGLLLILSSCLRSGTGVEGGSGAEEEGGSSAMADW